MKLLVGKKKRVEFGNPICIYWLCEGLGRSWKR
jgi:hypothetical protein